MARLAEWLACQRSNPLFDHDLVHLLLWDLADAVLRWLREPSDEGAKESMGEAHAEFAAAWELYQGRGEE